jgi:hypothetical protein
MGKVNDGSDIMMRPRKNAVLTRRNPIFNYSLAMDLPYEEIIDDLVVFKDGSLGACYRVNPLYMDSMEEVARFKVEKALGNMVNGLPIGTYMQIVWRKTARLPILEQHRKQIQSGDPLVHIMTDDRVNFWKRLAAAHEVFGVSCEIWFRRNYPRSVPRGGFVGLGVSPDRDIKAYLKEHHRIARDFRATCDRIVNPVKEILEVRREDSNGIFESLWTHFFGTENIPSYSNRKPLSAYFGACDFASNWGYLALGSRDRLVSILSMHDSPEVSFMMCANYLLTVNHPITLVMNLTPVSMGRARETLKRRLRRYEAFISRTDPESEKRAAELTQLLTELESSRNMIIDTEIYGLCEGKNLQELEQTVSDLADAGRAMDMDLQQEKAALYPCFLASLPGQAWVGKTDRSLWMKTDNVANFAPVLGPMKSANRPIMLMRAPYQTIYGYDPFDDRLPAAHAIVFGSTGAGKSFTTTLLLQSFMSQNPLVFIVDKGGSYEKLTKMVGGSYIDLSRGDVSFNPLEGKANWESRIMTVSLIFQEMVRETPGQPVTRDEQVVLDRMIRALYQAFNEPSVDREPTISDAVRFLREGAFFDPEKEPELEPVQRKLCRYLSNWTREEGNGVYGKLVDNPRTNVSLNSNFISFDLLGIDRYKDLSNVVFLTINDIIMNKVTKDRQRYKVVVFDECWSMLSTEEGAKFLEELYRTMRKYQCMVMAISQDIEDFSNASVANALLSNTYQMFILRQTSGAGADKVQRVLKLNNSERDLVSILRQEKGYYSEILLKIAGVSSKVALVPSPVEYWMATTDPKDKEIMANYLSQGIPLPEALKSLAEKYPHGVAASLH